MKIEIKQTVKTTGKVRMIPKKDKNKPKDNNVKIEL